MNDLANQSRTWEADGTDVPLSGSVPFAAGAAMPSVVRIPVPNSGGLAVELRPRGWVPQGGTTSTIFIQDMTGKRHLRLDYGYNVRTRTIDYHWNQKGTANIFGIQNHAPAGRHGGVLYRAGKYLRWGGRVLFIVGAAVDIVSIAQASNPVRRASQVVAGWAGAWAGCKILGAGGAAVGSAAPGLGTGAGALGGCIIGGAAGYFAGSAVGGVVYDWAEGTIFTPLPEMSRP